MVILNIQWIHLCLLETIIKVLLDWLTDRYQQGAKKAEQEEMRIVSVRIVWVVFFGCCYVFSVWPCVLKQRWWLFLGRKSRPCSSFPTVHPGTKAYTSGLQWEVMWECPAIGGVSLVQSLATPDWLCMCPQPGHKPCHNGCLCPQVLPACPLSSSVFLCAKTYRLRVSKSLCVCNWTCVFMCVFVFARTVCV